MNEFEIEELAKHSEKIEQYLRNNMLVAASEFREGNLGKSKELYAKTFGEAVQYGFDMVAWASDACIQHMSFKRQFAVPVSSIGGRKIPQHLDFSKHMVIDQLMMDEAYKIVTTVHQPLENQRAILCSELYLWMQTEMGGEHGFHLVESAQSFIITHGSIPIRHQTAIYNMLNRYSMFTIE